MANKFLKCLSLLMILTLSICGTAAAKSLAEINSIHAYDINGEILRIEVEFTGNLNADDVSIKAKGNIFTIVLENMTPGKITKTNGTNIDDNDFVKKINIKETEKKRTRIRLKLSAQVNDDGYKFSVQPARSENKPARLVIDITKNNMQNAPETKTDVDTRTDTETEYVEPENTAEVVEENPKPKIKLSDRVVVIDAGHGGSDTGAVGPRGTTEKEVALAVALKTEKLLQNDGVKVVMTRRTDIDVAMPNASNTAELQARVNKVPNNADIFISIHCNAFSNPKSNGMETYYFNTSVKGKRLAQLLNEELAKAGGLNNRGVKAANFYVIKRTKCPASLIEIGFITNPEEEKLLASDKYQNKIAGAIASAVKRFFMN